MSRYYRMRAATPAHMYVPFARSEARKTVARKMDPRMWALSFVGAVLGLNDHKSGQPGEWYWMYGGVVVTDWAANGRYLKVRPVNRKTGEPNANASAHWVNASHYYRAFDSLEVFALTCKLADMQKQVESAKAIAEAGVQEKLSLLSQNTVTRALVHAHDNDYCHETAVALISAGHKMPDLTLSFEVTIPVTVTLEGNSSYYALRRVFGETRGEVQGASGLYVSGVDAVDQAIRDQLSNGDYYLSDDSVRHTDTEVEWKNPILRQVDSYEAQREISNY